MMKYTKLFDGEYVTFGQAPSKKHDFVFAFLIPLKEQIEYVKKNYKPDVVMTVCETEPVHQDYKLIFDAFSTVLVPSEFCKRILEKQFHVKTTVFPHWGGDVSIKKQIFEEPYTFYTIGNVIDQRKNIPMLIDAWTKCKFPNARLLIKATCIQNVHWKIPGVEIVNGLLSDTDMEKIHTQSHCYINCSKSEGVGMGAVEAALRNKPVIITDFGGLKEYVKTPFVIQCTETTVGNEDFLFQPHMKWGEPSLDELILYMKFCYDKKIYIWDHQHTRDFTSGSMLRTKLATLRTKLARSSV